MVGYWADTTLWSFVKNINLMLFKSIYLTVFFYFFFNFFLSNCLFLPSTSLQQQDYMIVLFSQVSYNGSRHQISHLGSPSKFWIKFFNIVVISAGMCCELPFLGYIYNCHPIFYNRTYNSLSLWSWIGHTNCNSCRFGSWCYNWPSHQRWDSSGRYLPGKTLGRVSWCQLARNAILWSWGINPILEMVKEFFLLCSQWPTSM